MSARRALPGAVVAALLVIGAAGCGNDTKTTSPPSVEVSTTVATTTTTVALTPQKSPTAAGAALLAAWRKGDRAAALMLALPAAVDALFAQPAKPTSDRGCTEPLNGSSDCAYRYGSGVINITAEASGAGWVVRSVVVEPGS